jgi:fido (protein-threonine AMPylation protein)
MHHLDADIRERMQHTKTEADKKELLAYVMWRLLWIHPFFDYNGRSVRLFGELFLIQH